MNKQMRLEIRVTVKDMYEFLMMHTYLRFSGFLNMVLSLIALVLFIITINDKFTTSSFLLLIGALLFPVINPILLYLKAKKQVASESYQKPFVYTLKEEGIHIQQENHQNLLQWGMIDRLKETKNSFLIYISPVQAFILPKRDIGTSQETFIALLREWLPANKVKVKKIK